VKEFYIALTKARDWILKNPQLHPMGLPFKFEIEKDLCLVTLNELAFSLDYLGFLSYGSYRVEDEVGRGSNNLDYSLRAIQLSSSMSC
jgi:hypothetical protein